jgi:uncharacterized SAM-binding protein YcdF (DUF218 family)
MGKEQELRELAKLKEKIPNKLDALVVLDSGYTVSPDGKYKPTLETKMRLWAAAQLYSLRLTSNLILCGGKVYGEELPPDSQIMKDFLLSKIIESRFGTKIPKEAILIEEKSRNTIENFRFVKDILDKHPEIQTIGVLSNWHHLISGAKIAAKVLDSKPEFFSAEEILKDRSSHYRALIKCFYLSWLAKPGSKEFRQALVAGTKDLFRLSVLIIDRKGRILDYLAERGITAGRINKKLP